MMHHVLRGFSTNYVLQTCLNQSLNLVQPRIRSDTTRYLVLTSFRFARSCLCLCSNKTGSRHCTRAVWSTFAEIHSTHPGALMHYSGLEFHFKV